MTTNLSYNTSTISLIIDGNWKLQKLISAAGGHRATGYRLERLSAWEGGPPFTGECHRSRLKLEGDF